MVEVLNQLPNGGAVLAVIVVVMIFLKKQEKYDERMTIIVKSFVDEVAQSRKEYLSQLNRLAGKKDQS